MSLKTIKNKISNLLSVILLAAMMPAPAHALTFRVTIDTRSLATQPTPPVPFSLDLQFINGDGAAANTVVISNFNLGRGGRPRGSANLIGDADGDLSSFVVLNDGLFLNELIQQFTPSALDPLSFTVDITDNFQGPTPDAFSIGILDSSGNGLPTSFFDAFMQIDITTTPTEVSYPSDPNTPPPGCPDCAPINIAAPSVNSVNSACDVDVTGKVSFSLGPVRPLGARNRFMQQVRITNTSTQTIDGNLLLALDGLPREVDVLRADGVTTCALPAGSPYVATGAKRLRPKQSAVVTLQFSNSGSQPIAFTPRLLVGTVSGKTDKEDGD